MQTIRCCIVRYICLWQKAHSISIQCYLITLRITFAFKASMHLNPTTHGNLAILTKEEETGSIFFLILDQFKLFGNGRFWEQPTCGNAIQARQPALAGNDIFCWYILLTVFGWMVSNITWCPIRSLPTDKHDREQRYLFCIFYFTPACLWKLQILVFQTSLRISLNFYSYNGDPWHTFQYLSLWVSAVYILFTSYILFTPVRKYMWTWK